MSDGGTAMSGYHPHTVAHPVSRTQLNAGSFIPSVLEMAVNSDLPGMVTARVRENVYDSVTGKCLLLPSGMKLVGSYDSKVALGQARQLLVWNRATYPNGDELNLAGMGSADVSGQSGLEAEVNNHWLRLFGTALGMSLVTAGVQMSVPPQPAAVNGNTAAPSFASNVSAALAQQYGQLGGQMMGKYLNVQPTLTNHPGERFNLVVPKNIIFPGCYKG
jgi:type IV secretory pathway VirB10-like protein